MIVWFYDISTIDQGFLSDDNAVLLRAVVDYFTYKGDKIHPTLPIHALAKRLKHASIVLFETKYLMRMVDSIFVIT